MFCVIISQSRYDTLLGLKGAIMKDIVKYARLLDLYGEVLTEKQYDAMESYYCMDLTLEEIAQNHDVSKQAVHYTLKNAENKLAKVEKQFHIAQKYQQIEDNINDVIKSVNNGATKDEIVNALKLVLNDIK